MRADQLLVARGLAASRTLAQRLIAAGRVRVGASPVRKAAEALDEDAALTVESGEEDRYVSRGGLKLAGALLECGLEVRGLRCLDVGQSTGGFTDCLLQAGAAQVVGIDVGHTQLHPRLRGDARVIALEGINARTLDPAVLGDAMPAQGFDLIVVDVSFISLTLVLPALATLAAPSAVLLALVKPQFEVGRAGLDGRGIVRDETLYRDVLATVSQCALGSGWAAARSFGSPLRGADGNREFFLHARRAAPHETAQHQESTR